MTYGIIHKWPKSRQWHCDRESKNPENFVDLNYGSYGRSLFLPEPQPAIRAAGLRWRAQRDISTRADCRGLCSLRKCDWNFGKTQNKLIQHHLCQDQIIRSILINGNLIRPTVGPMKFDWCINLLDLAVDCYPLQCGQYGEMQFYRLWDWSSHSEGHFAISHISILIRCVRPSWRCRTSRSWTEISPRRNRAALRPR